uniref:Protein chloroplastic-like n=1 Tax=Tetraselmis sp. GSL018 TaxID=582737 RepID=A0A061R7N3_9CHLO|mmetsp:Transcript_9143/g.22031  ORF Transcript_9143/g.22031 Transcript_9143/m.22031 type:complete len:187 (-) Transcript_9143:26-586(-)
MISQLSRSKFFSPLSGFQARSPDRQRRGTPFQVTAVKTNKRGKVSSRPGQPSKKQLKKQAEDIKKQFSSVDTESTSASEDIEGIEETPTEITDNMLQRIVIFAGVPVFVGFLMFPAFYYLKVAKGIDLPTWVVYLATGLAFGGGLFGISYGVLSASWDPRRKGSALGLTEFRANLPILLEQMRRGR